MQAHVFTGHVPTIPDTALSLLSLVQPFKASFPSAPASPAGGAVGLKVFQLLLVLEVSAQGLRSFHRPWLSVPATQLRKQRLTFYCKHPELVDQPVWQCRAGQSANVMNEIRSKAEWRTGQVRLPVAASIH